MSDSFNAQDRWYSSVSDIDDCDLCARGSSSFFHVTAARQVLSTFLTIGTKPSQLRLSK